MLLILSQFATFNPLLKKKIEINFIMLKVLFTVAQPKRNKKYYYRYYRKFWVT